MKKYDTIIIGAGAAGLYCGCALDGGKNLILEKGKRPGLKLLMAGSGQCNVTHGGSIKDFLAHYGTENRYVVFCNASIICHCVECWRILVLRLWNVKMEKFFQSP